MIKLEIIVLVTMTAIILAFSVAGQTKKNSETSLSDEDTIREIVFKKILPEKTSDIGDLRDFYLSVDDGENPSSNLLKRFDEYQKKNRVKIKRVSESFISKNDGDMVLDEITKKQGILFSVSKLRWKNKDEVKVNAGSYIGNMGSDSCTYILKRQNGEWKIVAAEECVVS
ncbi:MAG: hypothetical protein ACR2N3_10505 [Pyrinomonadaceae bacterium]